MHAPRRLHAIIRHDTPPPRTRPIASLRPTEWIQLGYCVIFAAAAWITVFARRPLPLARRINVSVMAIAAAVILAITHATRQHVSIKAWPILLDCVTVALFLIPYWQTGQFFLGPNQRLQQALLALDERLLPRASKQAGTRRNAFGALLELSYLFCYPLVPVGLACVYLFGLRDHVQGFWLVVLIATYACYAATPLVPAYPPRSLLAANAAGTSDGEATLTASEREKTGKTRLFNLFLLKHGSIHAISFPSAHVASAFAIALALGYYKPVLGAVFLVIAVMISLGAVIGRYHYALDVLLGAATAVITFLCCLRWM